MTDLAWRQDAAAIAKLYPGPLCSLGLRGRMDKAEYVARAPIYYALAIAVALERSSGPMPEFKIKSQFPHVDDSSPHEGGTLLDRWMIWERAVGWLVARNMVKIKNDPFGPPIFSQSDDFEEQWNELILDEELPFSTYQAAGKSDDCWSPRSTL